jgi:hypothetical protein
VVVQHGVAGQECWVDRQRGPWWGVLDDLSPRKTFAARDRRRYGRQPRWCQRKEGRKAESWQSWNVWPTMRCHAEASEARMGEGTQRLATVLEVFWNQTQGNFWLLMRLLLQWDGSRNKARWQQQGLLMSRTWLLKNGNWGGLSKNSKTKKKVRNTVLWFNFSLGKFTYIPRFVLGNVCI